MTWHACKNAENEWKLHESWILPGKIFCFWKNMKTLECGDHATYTMCSFCVELSESFSSRLAGKDRRTDSFSPFRIVPFMYAFVVASARVHREQRRKLGSWMYSCASVSVFLHAFLLLFVCFLAKMKYERPIILSKCMDFEQAEFSVRDVRASSYFTSYVSQKEV